MAKDKTNPGQGPGDPETEKRGRQWTFRSTKKNG
jgi:hypothetical protein